MLLGHVPRSASRSQLWFAGITFVNRLIITGRIIQESVYEDAIHAKALKKSLFQSLLSMIGLVPYT